MACGCPVVASRIPSTNEIAGECPIYFNAAEPDDLINAFNTALSEGRNSKRVKVGFEKNKTYTWNKTAGATLEVYRSI